MNPLSPRRSAFSLLLTVGFGFGVWCQSQPPATSLLSSATAQTADPAPTVAGPLPTTLQPESTPTPGATPGTLSPAMSARIAGSNSAEQRLAPPDTFYLLSYVSVKTDKGVEGFEPGEEVRLVEVHHPTRTLVVTNGRAQVEVPPEKLTNDLEVAALVRQKDTANQARIAAYTQAQQEAYQKYEREVAANTAKEIEERKEEKKEQLADAREAAQDKIDHPNALSTPAPPQDNATSGANGYGAGGYYDNGGSGYGSPFAYFVNNPGPTAANKPATPTAPAVPSNVAPPAARGAAPSKPR